MYSLLLRTNVIDTYKKKRMNVIDVSVHLLRVTGGMMGSSVKDNMPVMDVVGFLLLLVSLHGL